MIKVKRKLQKHLKKISSEHKKRLKQFIADTTETDLTIAEYKKTLDQEESLHKVYRTDINKYDKDIKAEID